MQAPTPTQAQGQTREFSTNAKSIQDLFLGPKDFYKVSSASLQEFSEKGVLGEIIDQALDISSTRPGTVIDVPYEVTISNSMRDFWQSAFYSHDRINTSTPFARELKLQDQVLPFYMMLFLAGAKSHEDQATVYMGYKNAHYHWPAFAGDTFKKRFIIRSLRTTSDQKNSIIKIHCQLINQRDVIVFTCEKTILFPFKVPQSEVQIPVPPVPKRHEFIEHLISQAETLQRIGSQSLTSLRPGQLILHTLTRPLSITHSMQLATLGRLTHERHFNSRVFGPKELYVPGGLVLALTCSLSSRDLHEVLYEDLNECSFPNDLTPGDTVGAITYVRSLYEHVSGDIEALDVRTIGIKNCDVHRVFANKELPQELFTPPLKDMKPSVLEELCRRSIPDMKGSIVCIADRKIYRQTPKHVPFLL